MENKSQEYKDTLKQILSNPEQVQEYLNVFINAQSDKFKKEYKTYTEEQAHSLYAHIIDDLVNTIIAIRSNRPSVKGSIKHNYNLIKALTEIKATRGKTPKDINLNHSSN